MKKFEQELKQKAHLNKIRNAKKTVSGSNNKNISRASSNKSDQAQVLLTLYEKKRFDSIPAYKLLRTAGLQQYTKGFIERGYGIRLATLSALSQKDKSKLYEDLKIMPGHTVKLDKLIQTLSKHSYQYDADLASNYSNQQKQIYAQESLASNSKIQGEGRQGSSGSGNSNRNSKIVDKLNIDVTKLKFNDSQYQKQLERVINQYTPNLQKSNKNIQKKANVFHEESATGSNSKSGKQPEKISINFNKLKLLQAKEFQTQKNIQKVGNQFTPLGDTKDKKKRTFNQKISEKKTPTSNPNTGQQARKYSKTKYIPNTNTKPQQIDFKKKASAVQSGIENKPTMKKIQHQNSNNNKLKSNNMDGNKKIRNLNLGIETNQTLQMSTAKIMDINFQLDKIRSLNRSFDGSLMSSTIANIDIEELVYAFSGYIFASVKAAPQPIEIKQPQVFNDAQLQIQQEQESIQDQVGNILRESYLHPLYRDDGAIDQEIQAQQPQGDGDQTQYIVNSDGECDQNQYQNKKGKKQNNEFLQVNQQKNLKQSSVSSFLGGQSYNFGLEQPLQIFNQPLPTQLDYFKPTIDSIANFIKNIVLTAKMQRQIPIMAAHYLKVFLKKTGIQFTSINYKRILVTLLLLASKIWDDQSFESPSFSKTFPEYTTILLNQMQKQVLKALDYKLKLDKKQFAQIYFQLRKYARKNARSCQNKKLNLQKIRQLQQGIKRDYKINYVDKRNSF